MDSLALPAPLLVKCGQSLFSAFKLAATPSCFIITQHLPNLLHSLAAVKENFQKTMITTINEGKTSKTERNVFSLQFYNINIYKYKKCLSNNSFVKFVREKRKI